MNHPNIPTKLLRSTVRQRGSSLLEVLVAILLVSIGLLGVAGLSSATFVYNKAAQLRLTGLALVNDYADRARVNVYGFDLGNYSITADLAIPAAGSPSKDDDATKTDAVNAKTAADAVATYDKSTFMTEVANRLPSGKAVVVSAPSAAARDMDIWLLWKEPNAGTANALFTAGSDNCPKAIKEATDNDYNCMYFKVGL